MRIIILMLTGLCLVSCHKAEDEAEKFLSVEIAHRKQYMSDKALRIKQLTNRPDKQYDDYVEIYEEYISFRFDSALHYSSKLKELAVGEEQKFDADLRYCQAIYNAGYHREVLDMLSAMNPNDALPRHLLSAYYILLGRTYHIINSLFADGHIGDKVLYKAIEYTDNEAVKFMMRTRIASHLNQYDSVLFFAHEALKYPTTDGQKSTLYSQIANAKYRLSNVDEAIHYYSFSAGYGIRNVTQEGLSLLTLADILAREHNDIDRAYEYITLAVEDAQFFGARQRIEAIGTILPVISAKQSELNAVNRTRMVVIIIVVIIALIIISTLYGHAQRMRHRLNRAHSAMQLSNRQLKEANAIKNRYLGTYFVSISHLVGSVERFGRSATRRLDQHSYTSLVELVRSLVAVYPEKSLYKDFDRIFLEIFPSFIDDFNRLLRTEERIENDTELSSSLRIFALIRLGITDTDTIAKILNCSITTIYNYRSRMRNKAIDALNFENNVKQIGI